MLSEEQFLNASLLMTVTLAGISTETSDLQPVNVLIPISVTLSGMVTEPRLEQPRKAYELIVVTPFSISTVLICCAISAHGTFALEVQFAIAPEPVTESFPPSKFQ